MGGQDIGPVEDRVAVGTVLGVCLGKIGSQIELDAMFDAAARAMVMGREQSGMAGDALTAAINSRGDEITVSGIVAGGAALFAMDLGVSDEWRSGGGVATDTVDRGRGGGGVFLHLTAVVMVVAVEITGMAIDAGAAIAVIVCGIAVAVHANDPLAVDAGMTEETGSMVHRGNRIGGVALVDAERGDGDGGGVVMAMAGVVGRQDFCLGIGEVVRAVALNTLGILGDGLYPWPIDRILKQWRRGVAIAAFAGMHGHRVVGRMTADAERGVEDMTETSHVWFERGHYRRRA